MTKHRGSTPNGDSPREVVDRLMSELERVVSAQPSLPVEAITNASPAAVRAVLIDARIEAAALLGAVDALETLAVTSVEAGDDDAAKACLLVREQLQEGAVLAQATLDELLKQYGAGGVAAEFLTDQLPRAR